MPDIGIGGFAPAAALALAALLALGWYVSRARADRRWRAVLDRYADQEQAKRGHSRRNFMLILSRKLGERIVVPQCGMAVTVLAVKGKAVRLGIDAPAEVTVLRDELVRPKTGLDNTTPEVGGGPR
jgi:carbon storage regulator CsrA